MSNETPKAARKKIASALNIIKRGLPFIYIVPFIGAGVVFAIWSMSAKPETCPIVLPRQEVSRASLSNTATSYDCVWLEELVTSDQQIKGLSGREKMHRNRGALFIYERPENACIWMKDMRFPLDIIWLDETKKIIKIEENVKPETYPQSFCMDGTGYVIEINAGIANQAGLKLGQQINL